MQLKFVFVLLLVYLTSQPARALDLSKTDQQAHFGVSFAATQVGYIGLRTVGWDNKKALLTSMFIAFAAGYAKEIRDIRPDDEDLQADALGLAIGALGPLFVYEW